MFVDDSLQKEKKMASMGVAAMDSCGHLLRVVGIPIEFIRKSIIAEALAIREALENTKENGWSKVQILSDAIVVVDMV
ncbi:hypothetical protein RND71_015593 [Anisodus tanguticus]|uniref:RNase H type-1 domain-containing protein n=1 Tax=Anisodus tanguticus TaxID=243964 RepID=A0AAE1S6K0_9SOLA|nr:hypothetical protein RND71_015593 [Anisodus tanguticus]